MEPGDEPHRPAADVFVAPAEGDAVADEEDLIGIRPLAALGGSKRLSRPRQGHGSFTEEQDALYMNKTEPQGSTIAG